MLFSVLPKNQHIIHFAHYASQSTQNSGHSHLEVLGGAGDSKWKFVKTLAAKGGYKCHQYLGVFAERNLPKAAVGI